MISVIEKLPRHVQEEVCSPWRFQAVGILR